MKNSFQTSGVALCGLATSLTAAGLNVIIEKLTGFNLFTFSFWFVIPVGAMLVGLAAASGYYFGARHLHKRATGILLLQMVVVAGLSQFLIYYIDYATYHLENGVRIANFVPFSEFLRLELTSAHYQITGRYGIHSDAGKVDSFGYVLAVFQFIGFLIGGFMMYMVLQSIPVCEPCDMYMRAIGKKTKYCVGPKEFHDYYNGVLASPPGSQAFADLIKLRNNTLDIKLSDSRINMTLHSCPNCQSKIMEIKVEANNCKEWKSADDLKRRISIPMSAKVKRLFV